MHLVQPLNKKKCWQHNSSLTFYIKPVAVLISTDKVVCYYVTDHLSGRGLSSFQIKIFENKYFALRRYLLRFSSIFLNSKLQQQYFTVKIAGNYCNTNP
jgi:hypothetical protein